MNSSVIPTEMLNPVSLSELFFSCNELLQCLGGQCVGHPSGHHVLCPLMMRLSDNSVKDAHE